MTVQVYTPPKQISVAMVPLVASVNIKYGQICAVDLSNSGHAVLQDNFPLAPPILPAIGIAANSALVGETVFVQTFGVIRIDGIAGANGDIIGTNQAASFPGDCVDLGQGLSAITAIMSVVGIVVEHDASGFLLLVMPFSAFPASGTNLNITDGNSAIFFDSPNQALQIADGIGNVIILRGVSGGIEFESINGNVDFNTHGFAFNLNGVPLVLPVFVDDETPATFTTNAEYILAHTPSPLSSLQVFINSEAIAKPGQDRLLVQGLDYHLGGAGNTHIIYDLTPTATNTIRCWYRR